MSRLQEARELLAATEGHTPGPWALAQYGPCLWDVVLDDGPGRITRRVCQDTNNLGDAFIIAAAPALRDLLAAMVAEVERLEVRDRVRPRELLPCNTCNGSGFCESHDPGTYFNCPECHLECWCFRCSADLTAGVPQ